jgi:ABC-type nitrate/sulfonate/bicarbonate transport system substrate-binding protein
VAKDNGIYAQHGLDVDQRGGGATTMMASLLAGELTLAVTGGPGS